MRVYLHIAILLFFAVNGSAQTWQPVGSDDFLQASYNSVSNEVTAISHDTLFIAFFEDYTNGMKVRKFNGGAWIDLPRPAAGKCYPDEFIADSTGNLYLFYHKADDHFIKKWNGSSWINISTPGSIAFGLDHSGAPFCITNDGSANYILKQFSGSSWIPLSTVVIPPPSNNASYKIGALHIDKAGIPYFAVAKVNSVYTQVYGIFKHAPSGWTPLDTLYGECRLLSFCLDTMGNPWCAQNGYVTKWNGSGWVTIGPQLVNTPNAHIVQIITNDNNVPYVITQEAPGLNITIRKFDGVNWVPATSGTLKGEVANTVFNNAQFPVVSYADFYHGHLRVQEWAGGNWTGKGVVGLSSASGFADIASNAAGVIYASHNDSNDHLAAMQISGSSLMPLPEIPVSTFYHPMDVNSTGVPYIPYRSNDTLKVLKFQGGTWQDAGTISLYSDASGIKIDKDDSLYIVFTGALPNSRLTVKKFNGNSWVTVGQSGFTSLQARDEDIAVADSGVYVAYRNYDYGQRVSVKVYKNGIWQYLGGPAVSFGAAGDISIAVDTLGRPFVAYRHGANGNKIEVKTFNGSSWVLVGGQAVSSNAGFCPKILLDHRALPYVMFGDVARQSRASLLRFNGFNWEDVNSEGISAGAINKPAMTISAGKIFACYNSVLKSGAPCDFFIKSLIIPPSVYITSDTDVICGTGTVSFHATVAFTDSTPAYQWKVNGVNAGADSSVFTPSALQNGDSVSCVITVGTAPALTASSNHIRISVYNPQVTINTTSTALCPGAVAVFRAEAWPDTGLSYQWYRNTAPVGTNSSQFSNSALTPSDLIKCVATNGCGSDTSNIISLPAFTTAVSGAPCNTEPLTLTSNAALAVLIWRLDGNEVETNYAAWSSSQIIAGTAASGSGLAALHNPSGIFVSGSGDIYIADGSNDRVIRYAPGAAAGVIVAGGNGQGSGLNQLNKPSGIWLKGADLYISDQDNHRVVKWTLGAATGVLVAGGNGPGTGSNQLNTPSGIYVSASNEIYVADQLNNRVQKWTPGASFGITVAGQASGSGGSALNKLSRPWGLFMETNGDLYISDQLNHRIVKWPASATTGILVAGGNGAGAGLNQLNRPAGIWRDVSGSTFVADMLNSRIVRWKPADVTGEVIGVAVLSKPQGLCINKQGSLYVAEQGSNNRVRKYLPKTDTAFTTYAAGNYTAVATSFSGCTSSSGPVNVQAAGIIASGARSGKIVNGDTVSFINGACKLLASIGDAPGGNEPGITAVTVSKDASIQTYNSKPYLQKHWDIQPQSNNAGYLTLYLSQGDMNAYNNYVTSNGLSYPLLPANPSNTANINHIVVTQFPGTPASGTTGPGGQYNQSAKILIPNSSITAAYTGSYWQLSFPVAGIGGGYFVHSGNTALREIAEVSETFLSENRDIRVFPNPASNTVYVESTTGLRAEASLKDVTGRFIARIVMDGRGSFDLSALPSGIYLLSYKDDRANKTIKFVKQ